MAPSNEMMTYMVVVPHNVHAGQQFQASLDGQLTMVVVPAGEGPGSTLHVRIPTTPSTVQKYAVTIPPGIAPNGRFQANLGTRLVTLTCPPNMRSGMQMLVDATTDQGAGSSGALTNNKTWPPPIAIPDSVMDSDEVPSFFMCSITGCIMRQPAVAPSGSTYELDAISEWLKNKDTDPATNLPLKVDDLYPNRAIRSMIEEYIAYGPLFLTQKR